MSNFIVNTLPTNSYVLFVSSVTNSKIIGLPPASTVPGRIVNITTANFFSTVRISTTGLDTFEGFSSIDTNLTFYGVLSTPNTSVSLGSDGISNWMVLGQEIPSTVLIQKNFSPSSLTIPLALWFDASDTNTITLSTNNTIGQWANKALPSEFLRRSSNSVVGTSSNTNSAITGVHTLFGKNVAWFSTGSEMFIPKLLNLGGISWSLFMVMVPFDGPSPTYPSTLLFGAPRNLNVPTNTIVYNNSTSLYEYDIRRGNINITNVRVTDNSLPLNQPYLFSMINFTTSNLNVITKNGLNYAQRNPSVNAGGYTGGTSNMFVNYASFSTSFDLAELIVYNGTINSNERQKVEGYLAWKWGLNYDSFWNGHPYKFVTPIS